MSDDELETVDLAWIKRVLGMSRWTVYRRVAERNFPNPCSPPNKPLRFRKSAILSKMKEQERAA